MFVTLCHPPPPFLLLLPLRATHIQSDSGAQLAPVIARQELLQGGPQFLGIQDVVELHQEQQNDGTKGRVVVDAVQGDDLIRRHPRRCLQLRVRELIAHFYLVVLSCLPMPKRKIDWQAQWILSSLGSDNQPRELYQKTLSFFLFQGVIQELSSATPLARIGISYALSKRIHGGTFYARRNWT